MHFGLRGHDQRGHTLLRLLPSSSKNEKLSFGKEVGDHLDIAIGRGRQRSDTDAPDAGRTASNFGRGRMHYWMHSRCMVALRRSAAAAQSKAFARAAATASTAENGLQLLPLGCVNPLSQVPWAAGGRFTQPMTRSLAKPCTVIVRIRPVAPRWCGMNPLNNERRKNRVFSPPSDSPSGD